MTSATDIFSNRAAYDKLCEARARLWVKSAFHGSLASQLQIVESPECETMATDSIRLFFSPDFVMAQPMPELIGTVAHEAEHCARGHIGRIGNRDLEQANIAADLAINADLIRFGFELPDGALIDWQYAGMSFEAIYSARAAAQRQQPPQPQPETAQGAQGGESGGNDSGGAGDSGENETDSGAGGDNNAGESGNESGTGAGDSGTGAGDSGTETGQGGESGGNNASGTPNASSGANSGESGQSGGNGGDNASGTESGGNGTPRGRAHGGTFGGIIKPQGATAADIAELSEQWAIRTRQAVAVASKGGDAIADYARGIIGELNESPVDIRQELRAYVDSRIAVNSTFNRPNRRFLAAGDILPGAQIDGLEHVVFIIDSSGSIDETMLKNAAAALVESVESGAIERLTVIWADSHVRHIQEFAAGDTIDAAALEYAGGGGTRFDNALQWAAENANDASAIVYLTDLEVFSADAWGIEPDCPLLWAVHGTRRDYERRAAGVPFGETVYCGFLD